MRIGVDFGGTKIETAMLDGQGRFLARDRAPNPGTYEEALTALADLVARVETETGVKGKTVGVGMPGSLSPRTGLVRNSNSTWLNGKPFLEDLRKRLGRPVRVANDANCFALSEAADGAAAGAGVVFGVIQGTGCGGGVTINGRVIEGVNGVAGEWGHLPLPWPQPDELPFERCWCGRLGCLETWISGTGLARTASLALGEPVDAETVVTRARGGDEAAQACRDRFWDRTARALAMIVDILDPDVIVFGGG
ncbi:MAG: ROK family protein, partial [Hyphomonadaceae bacterium]